MDKAAIPCLAFCASSGTGKTTLLCQLIKILKLEFGLTVGVVKSSHHDFEIDIPGKDSYKLRKAGASTMVITSPYRQAIIHEKAPPGDSLLADQLRIFEANPVDLILLEGFSHEAIPKIELHRSELDNPLRLLGDTNLIAVATDSSQNMLPNSVKQLDINQPEQIANFIVNWLARLKNQKSL